MAATIDIDIDIDTVSTDNRPHDHRAKQVRKARRLNHSFRYLYRHDTDISDESSVDDNITTRDYLVKHGGYTHEQIDEMHQRFPPLLELDVQRHLAPKMRFMKETILEMTNDIDRATVMLPANVRASLPPQYYGSRLERIIAPRHAFLVHAKLPHGKELLLGNNIGAEESESSTTNNDNNNVAIITTTTRWQDFLKSCRNAKQFAALCNRWAREDAQEEDPPSLNNDLVTPKKIEAFDLLFGRGLMAAARDELYPASNDWPSDHINITSGEMIDLLVQHGANPLERDNRGVSLLHWAAGSGNLGGVQALLPSFLDDNNNNDEGEGFFVQAERDGATPLHWAAAGASAREFGVGGHPEVCQYILSQVTLTSKSSLSVTSSSTSSSSPPDNRQNRRRQLVSQLTRDGNSALMWAAWSGTLETVKFLIRDRADHTIANRNGCTVAHWASSGGNVKVCQYLADTVGVDFTEPNNGGNTPLTHAVAFGRKDVVEWLLHDVVNKNKEDDDSMAASLAGDFVDWAPGDEKRQDVLKLFEDWYGEDTL